MHEMRIRHFTEADIPVRAELLRDSKFQANLTDFAVSTDDATLTGGQLRTIREEHRTKRIFTICCEPSGQVAGFAWITSIDWRAQCCELSFAVLPRYRRGMGALAVSAAHEYLRRELNMRVIINQVLEHNQMMHSARTLAQQRQVRCALDSYTLGEWRTACYWTFGEQDGTQWRQEAGDRRRQIADRIRTARGQQP
jgi:RimJ/RimL family protein N-acetyltransferase